MEKSQGKIGVSWRNQKKMRKKCETFFTEKMSDEEFNQKILEEFLKEAEEIEKEAIQISEALDCEPTDDGFQKLMAEINRREFSEEVNSHVINVDDRKIQTSELKNVKPHREPCKSRQGKRKIRKGVRCASAVIAVLIGVFSVSMTSEANRAYVMREINELFGNDVNTKVNNNEVLESDRIEQYVREDIENTLGIKMPEFFYLPAEMKYKKYIINEESGIAIVQYAYRENYIYFMIMANSKDATSLSQNDKGKEIKKISNELLPNFKITMWEIYEKEDEKPTYTLGWNYKNTYYQLLGKLPMGETEKIARNILY